MSRRRKIVLAAILVLILIWAMCPKPKPPHPVPAARLHDPIETGSHDAR